MKTHRHGFTLVEMAVVLAIIGLIVGSILAGQSMLRDQKARRVLTEVESYAAALQQFSDKYGAIPGDMPDAERIWGRAGGGDVNTACANAATAVSDGTTTCNGNGDGAINTTPESYWAWQQLKAAGLIAGNYTGIAGAGLNPGVNVPKGPMDQSGYAMLTIGVWPITVSSFFAGDYSKAFMFTRLYPGIPYGWGGILTPFEASSIDKKVDDGLPGMGNVRGPTNSGMSTCVAGNVAALAYYYVTSTVATCPLIFMGSFNAKPQS